MSNEHHSTDIEAVLSRSRIIFLGLFVLCIASFTGSLYIGLESGEIQKKITSAQKQWRDFQKSLEPLPTPKPIIIQTYPTPTESVPTPPSTPVKQASSPDTTSGSAPYPTAIPGRPGSKEWEDEFWRKWNEMSNSKPSTSTYSFPTPIPGAPGSKEWNENFNRKSQQMQQDFENMKKEICTKSPSLCK